MTILIEATLSSVTVISQTRIDIRWESPDRFHLVHIWAKEGAGAYANVGEAGGYKEYFSYRNLTANTAYCIKIKTESIEPDYVSGFSGELCVTTFDNLEAPTNLVANAYSDTEIEITFEDNALNEDDYRLERKEDGGGYAEVATLAKNQTYYLDDSLDNTKTYTYKIRAKQGLVYSSYSNEDSAQPYQAPSVPANLSIDDKTDETMDLSWDASTGDLTGYIVEISDDGGANYEEIIRLKAGITEHIAIGLIPSTTYHFRVAAYGPGGISGWSNVVNDTTNAAYEYTEFEKFVSDPIINPIFLIEINPKMDLHGWSLTGGQTDTYEITIAERGIDYDEVWDDGTTLTERASIALVEANAGSFYCDFHGRKLYVHTTDSIDPRVSLIEAGFWLYFTNSDDPDRNIVFNDHNYLPYFKRQDIPTITLEVKSLFAGTFSIGSGSISFMNAYDKAVGGYYFDKINEKFTWRNRNLVIKLGKDSFSYADFKPIFTGKIDSVFCVDEKFKVNLKDMRKDFNQNLVLNKYTFEDYPGLEEDFENEPINKLWGVKDRVVPIPIDWDNKRFKFNDGRSRRVYEVRQNDTALTENTDYYVDLDNSIITFDDAFDILEEDIIEVMFWGVTNAAGETIQNGADIFIDIMINHFGLTLSDINLPETIKTKQLSPKKCSLLLQKDTPYEEIIRQLEQTIGAYTFVDENGKIGLKMLERTIPSSYRHIKNHMIRNYREQKGTKDLFYEVEVLFDEDPQTQDWQSRSATIDSIKNRFDVETQKKQIYTYFQDPYHAQQWAYEILDLLNKPTITFETSAMLFGKRPGDIIKISRDRAFNEDGTASSIHLEILKLQFSCSKMTTKVLAKKFITKKHLRDDFDGYDLEYYWEKDNETADTTIIVENGVLTIEIKNSAEGRWWCTFNDAPKIIRPLHITNLGLRKPVDIITKINSYTVNDDTMAGIFIGLYPKNTDGGGDLLAYKWGRHKDGSAGYDGLRLQRNCGSYDEAAITTLPVWLKIRIDTSDDITFWYSLDGETWTQFEHGGGPLAISNYYADGIKIGLFAKNIDGNENLAAPFEYFEILGS